MTKARYNPFFSALLVPVCLVIFNTSLTQADPHDQYPLTGGHQNLSCSQCHPDSSKPQVANCIACHTIDIPTRTTCTICHASIQNQYTNTHQTTHFGRHCNQCHGTANWIIVNDVEDRQRCISCHEEDKPHNHFKINDCNLCHQGELWRQNKFEHKGFSSCQTCHTRPYDHKSGKCESCHDTKKWENGTRFPIKNLFKW